MKKVFLLAGFTFLLGTVTFAQFTYGVKAGLNLANATIKSDAGSTSTSALTGLHLGATAEYAVNDKFSVEPGLLFSTKGVKYSGEGNVRTSVNYLEIPVNGVYKIDAGSAKVLLNAGPYLGFALSGKTKFDGGSESLKIGSGEDKDLKAFDFGLNFGAGVLLNNKITIGLQYGLGIANLAPVTDGGNTIRNKVFAISVGYKFVK
jgi:hypothetical protein